MNLILNGRYNVTVAIALIVIILPFLLSSTFHLRMATMVIIFSVVVIGLNLLMGYAGQVSLGHAGFLALGAYAAAFGPAHLGLNPWISMALGILATSAIAYLIGKPILKLKGYHLAMATLAFGIVVALVLNNELNWTGGPDGMGVKRANLAILGLTHVQSWYAISSAVLVLAILLVQNLLNSSTGRALRSIHDSEVASNVLGIDVTRQKLVAFVLSAALAAAAGSCLAQLDGHVTPATGSILKSIELLTMAVIGGLGSLVGSIVGAAFLVLMPQFLTAFHEYEHAMLGVMLIFTMIVMRNGIVPSLTTLLRRKVQ